MTLKHPATPPAGTVAGSRSRPARRGEMWRYRHFYLFISPFFILFALFGLYPLVFSLFLSFVKWNGLSDWEWVGLGNFNAMLADDLLARSLWNTLVIGLLYVPPMMALAFLFAEILNRQWLKLRAFYRAAFFLPCVTPMVVIAIVFSLMFSSERGVLNYGLMRLGEMLPFLHLQPVPWLTSEEWSKPSIAILTAWRWTGYNMVLMLAGLQGIPVEHHEAAMVDGASWWQRIRNVTLPHMRPTFLFCGLLSLLGTIYMFDEVFVLTNGGPGTSSLNFGLYLFNVAFNDFKFGYASCVAYTVAVVVFLATLLLNRLSRRGAEGE